MFGLDPFTLGCAACAIIFFIAFIVVLVLNVRKDIDSKKLSKENENLNVMLDTKEVELATLELETSAALQEAYLNTKRAIEIFDGYKLRTDNIKELMVKLNFAGQPDSIQNLVEGPLIDLILQFAQGILVAAELEGHTLEHIVLIDHDDDGMPDETQISELLTKATDNAKCCNKENCTHKVLTTQEIEEITNPGVPLAELQKGADHDINHPFPIQNLEDVQKQANQFAMSADGPDSVQAAKEAMDATDVLIEDEELDVVDSDGDQLPADIKNYLKQVKEEIKEGTFKGVRMPTDALDSVQAFKAWISTVDFEKDAEVIEITNPDLLD